MLKKRTQPRSLKKITRVNKTVVSHKKDRVKKSKDLELTLDIISQYIRTRAYYVWEEMKKPLGKDLEIWRKAEKRIISQLFKK